MLQVQLLFLCHAQIILFLSSSSDATGFLVHQCLHHVLIFIVLQDTVTMHLLHARNLYTIAWKQHICHQHQEQIHEPSMAAVPISQPTALGSRSDIIILLYYWPMFRIFWELEWQIWIPTTGMIIAWWHQENALCLQDVLGLPKVD